MLSEMLAKLSPEILAFVVDLVRGISESTSKRQAARKAIIIATKHAIVS